MEEIISLRNSTYKEIQDKYEAKKDSQKKNINKNFKNIMLKIIEDNATKQNPTSQSVLRNICQAHGEQMPKICFPVKNIDNLRQNFDHWKEGRSAEHLKNRDALLDFLLYFNYKHYQGRPFEESKKDFNATLAQLGHPDRLYIFRPIDFCVLVALKLSESNPNEDIYLAFCKLFNEMCGSYETAKYVEAINQLNEHTQLTKSYDEDFNGIKDYDTARMFVENNAHEFGRSHVTSYRVFLKLIDGDNKEVSCEKYQKIFSRYCNDTVCALQNKYYNTFCWTGNDDSEFKDKSYIDNIVFKAYDYQIESVSREILLQMIIHNVHISSPGNKRNPFNTNKLLLKINNSLEHVGMAPLSPEFATDFLLLSAIDSLDWLSEHEHPFRLFQKIVRLPEQIKKAKDEKQKKQNYIKNHESKYLEAKEFNEKHGHDNQKRKQIDCNYQNIIKPYKRTEREIGELEAKINQLQEMQAQYQV